MAREPGRAVDNRLDSAPRPLVLLPAQVDHPRDERRPPQRAKAAARAKASFAPESVSLSFIVRNAPPVSLAGFFAMRSTPI